MYIKKFSNSIYLSLFAVALFLLVAVSCTNETTEDNSLSPNSVQIVLSVPQNTTRATVNPIGDESYIKDVRVLFFKESSNNVWLLERNEKEEIKVDGNDVTATSITIEGVTNPKVARSIFVIANWADYTEELLKIGVTTQEDFLVKSITQITTPINAPTKAVPLLMFGKKDKHLFTDGKATITLTRQVAKINLTVKLSENFIKSGLLDNNYRPGWTAAAIADPATQPTLYLQNIPTAAFVHPVQNFPTNYELMEYENQKPLSAANEFLVTDSYFVYPNWIMGGEATAKEKATTVQLHLPLKLADGTIIDKNYYSVSIKTADFTPNIYWICPNYVYDVVVTVNGFGDEINPRPEFNLDVKIVVSDWDTVDLPEQMRGDYVRFMRMTRENSSELTDGATVSAGEILKFFCKTNIGEWYTITRNQDGIVVPNGKSVITDKVVNTPLGKEQEVTIYIPDNDNNTKYTIELYQAKLAPEAGGAMRTITLNQKKESVNYVKTVRKSNDKEMSNGSWIMEDGDELNVYCNCSVEGWYAEVINESNNVRDTSGIAVSSGLQFVTVEIPKTTKYTKYTIEVHHPRLATLPGNPVITGVQSHGTVPRAEILKGVSYNSTINTWLGTLPANGLQLAKKGNVLPTGNNKTNEEYAIWGPNINVTSLSLSKNLGSGKNNTKKLVSKGEFTPAKSCNAMSTNGEWYLPSVYELMMISQHYMTFSPSYSILIGCWTSNDSPNLNHANAFYVEPSTLANPNAVINRNASFPFSCVHNI